MEAVFRKSMHDTAKTEEPYEIDKMSRDKKEIIFEFGSVTFFLISGKCNLLRFFPNDFPLLAFHRHRE